MLGGVFKALFKVPVRRAFTKPLQDTWTLKFEMVMEMLYSGREPNLNLEKFERNLKKTRKDAIKGVASLNPLPKSVKVTPVQVADKPWKAEWVDVNAKPNKTGKSKTQQKGAIIFTSFLFHQISHFLHSWRSFLFVFSKKSSFPPVQDLPAD